MKQEKSGATIHCPVHKLQDTYILYKGKKIIGVGCVKCYKLN